MRLARGVQSEVAAIDPNQPLSEIRTLEQVTSEVFSQLHVIGALLGVFAALGLGLAALGVYSVLAYSVAERTTEIGIRIALGAEPGHVFRLVLGQELRWVLSGVAIGLAGAYALARTLTGMVSGIEPSHSGPFAAVALVVFLVVLLAVSSPLRRAIRISPMEALRNE
jgi:putative ABC transport system permease protein